jgi:hypothetical protein
VVQFIAQPSKLSPDIVMAILHGKPLSLHIMGGSIKWLNEGSFSAAVLNRIYTRVLYNLPYSKRYPNQLLDQGITVPGELGPVHLHLPINILVHASNEGCSDVVAELKAMLLLPNQTDSEGLIDKLNVTSYLKDMDSQNNHVVDSNDDAINDSILSSDISLKAKFKILLSFYQCESRVIELVDDNIQIPKLGLPHNYFISYSLFWFNKATTYSGSRVAIY